MYIFTTCLYISIVSHYIILYLYHMKYYISYITLYYMTLFYIILYCIKIILLYKIILYYIILYYIILYYIILYYIILYYTILYYIILYYIILYYIILYIFKLYDINIELYYIFYCIVLYYMILFCKWDDIISDMILQVIWQDKWYSIMSFYLISIYYLAHTYRCNMMQYGASFSQHPPSHIFSLQ